MTLGPSPADPASGPGSEAHSSPQEPARFSAREVAGSFLSLLGLLLVLSTVLVNPWVLPRVVGSSLVDHGDVLAGYAITALVIGALHVGLGALVASGRAPRLDGAVLLVVILSGLVLVDRLLLAFLGLPLWIHDSELGYRNRPHKVVSLASRGRPGTWVRINAYGQHDPEDFPVAKPPGEFRALLLGDSVAFGDGLPANEDFSEQLEDILDARDGRFRSHRVINTGVHGYSTFQELRMLQESLRFDPDFVMLEFCMNDVTEPFVSNREFGGTTLDYHGVWQTTSGLLGYLLTDTGIGRLLQKLRAPAESLEQKKRLESYNVVELAEEGMTNPRYKEAWGIVLRDLGEVNQVVREHHLPFVLLVFPFTFQIIDPTVRGPQKILADFAKEHDMAVMDLTGLFERNIYDDAQLVAFLRKRGYSPADIERFFSWRVRKFFLDSDHPAPAGHRIVAEALADYLERTGIVGAAPAPAGGSPGAAGSPPLSGG